MNFITQIKKQNTSTLESSPRAPSHLTASVNHTPTKGEQNLDLKQIDLYLHARIQDVSCTCMDASMTGFFLLNIMFEINSYCYVEL